jgi:hypothetical protein
VVFVVQLPDPKDVTRFLSDLLGRDVVVAKQDPLLKPAEAFAVRVYVHGGVPGEKHPGDGQPAAVLLMDRPAAAFIGSALSLVPKGAAEESAKGPAWMDTLTDNVAEVLNVMTGLFNKGAVRHVIPGHWSVKAPVRPEDGVFVNLGRQKLALRITVPGYGVGRISLFA